MTLQMVRMLVAEGHEVTVVSPRPSAAHLDAALAGAASPRAVRKVLRSTGATELVFCISPGMPFTRAKGISQQVLAIRLAAALRACPALERVRLVMAQEPGVTARVLRHLWAVADEVWLPADSDPNDIIRHAPELEASIRVLPRAAPTWPVPRAVVTVTGPREHQSLRGGGRLFHALHWRLVDLPRRLRRLPRWSLHRFRVLVGPAVRPALYKVRAWRLEHKSRTT